MNISTQSDSWEFSPDFDAKRRARLEAVSSFDAVIDHIVNETKNIRAEICNGNAPGITECRRTVFSFEVMPDTFDAFFNSPVGYRAQFLSDPDLGQAANGRLISCLVANLVEVASSAEATTEITQSEIESSLLAASAKIWVHEDYFPFQSLTQDLAVVDWLAAAKAGIKKAQWGLCAPATFVLQIKGAFIDPWGNENEVVPKNKIGRRFEIKKYGFS